MQSTMNMQSMFLDITSKPVAIGLIAGLTIVLYAIVSSILSWARLRHIPGPPGASLSSWWMSKHAIRGDLCTALFEASRKYGPVVRAGPNLVVTGEPSVLRRIWAVRSSYKRGPFYEAIRFNPDRDHLVSMRDDRKHAVLRAKMASGYSGKENESLEATVDTEILSLVNLLERKYISTSTEYRPVDLAYKAQYMTLDVISALAFGKRFGFTEQDKDVYSYIQMTEKTLPFMVLLTQFPTVARLLQSRFLRQFLPSEKDPIGFGAFIGVAKKIVAERLASDNPYRKDMLGSFLAHGLTQDEAEGEVLLQVLAGSDTTATAIRMTLLYLMTTPAAYQRLAKEVREAAAEGRISAPVTYAEAQQLPYLQAVIREGVRMNPPAATTLEVVVPPGGDVFCGVPVPEGTMVGCDMFRAQRDFDIYGIDADIFRPERWLEADPTQVKEMMATWMLIFKSGKWQCLGKDIAVLELNKVFVELLRRFDFSVVNPLKPCKSFNAGIFFMSNFYTRITRIEPTKE